MMCFGATTIDAMGERGAAKIGVDAAHDDADAGHARARSPGIRAGSASSGRRCRPGEFCVERPARIAVGARSESRDRSGFAGRKERGRVAEAFPPARRSRLEVRCGWTGSARSPRARAPTRSAVSWPPLPRAVRSASISAMRNDGAEREFHPSTLRKILRFSNPRARVLSRSTMFQANIKVIPSHSCRLRCLRPPPRIRNAQGANIRRRGCRHAAGKHEKRNDCHPRRL